MRLRLAALLLALWASAASAQNVTVIGGVTPGHIPVFNSTTTLKDSSSSSLAGILGPNTSTTNGLALWANPGGTVLEDGATAGQTIPGTYIWSGAQNYSATNPTNSWFGTQQLDVLNITANYDNNIVIAPGFNDADAIDVNIVASHGNYMSGGLTSAKTTFITQQINGTYQAQGQRALQSGTLNCYGTGDCSIATWFLTVAQYPRSGDEGVGYGLASRLQQLTPVQLVTVTGSSRNTCNTTTTQAITGSATAQTVNVASGTGCTVGTWVVVNHEAATAFVNHEAVKITASTSTSITAAFASNQNSGATITPAVDLTYSGGAGSFVGEGRVLVDTTATPYTTGTVTSITTTGGAQFVGTGTAWSNTMLSGGTALVPGCISLAADDYTSSPYGAGAAALHDWYQIQSVTDATHLNILSFSSSGSQAYNGKGPGSGSYTVRPCAEVLRVLSGGEAILDTNNFTWTNGHQLDISLPPYPDVTGFQWFASFYSSGGTYRHMVDYNNTGARAFQAAIGISAPFGAIGTPGADTVGFQTGITIGSVGVGIDLSGANNPPTIASMRLAGGPNFGQGTAAATRIAWGGTNSNNPSIGMNMGSNAGALSVNFNGSANTFGILDGKPTGIAGTYYLQYNGSIMIPPIAFANGGGSAIVACSSTTEGLLQSFNDSNTITVGATIAGFGTNHVLGRCNGTNWIVASP